MGVTNGFEIVRKGSLCTACQRSYNGASGCRCASRAYNHFGAAGWMFVLPNGSSCETVSGRHYFFYPGQLFKLIKQITRVDFWSITKSCTCVLFLNLPPNKGISNQRGRRIPPLSPGRYPYVVAVACMSLVHQENKFPQVFPLDHGTSLAYIFATLGPVL